MKIIKENMKFVRPNMKYIFVGIAVFSLVIFISLNNKKNINLDFYAKKIIQICTSDSYKRGCYDREIPKLLARGIVSMEDAFAVTAKIQKTDKSYLYCHVLGHELADIETRKNTDKWLDVITRCPALACNNGCEHGAVMRRFKGSDVLSETQLTAILPDLKIACEPRGAWNPTEVERSMCYHSMGHLAMYITDANINKSLSICRDIGIKNDGRSYYQTCVQGVFMIIFQSLDQDDVSLVAKIKPKKENLDIFCGKFDGVEFVACKTEAWPYFYEEIKTPHGLAGFCSFAKNKYDNDWCYDTGLRGQVTREILENKGVIGVSNFCLQLPPNIRERCFPSVATGWIQNEPGYISDSVDLCNIGQKYGYGDACFKGLLFFSKFSFNKGSEIWKSYCNNFPVPYKEKCFAGDVPGSW